MTQSKAAAVANALITAGYKVTVYVLSSGEWAMRVRSSNTPISASTVAAFASGQSVNANILEVEFV